MNAKFAFGLAVAAMTSAALGNVTGANGPVTLDGKLDQLEKKQEKLNKQEKEIEELKNEIRGIREKQHEKLEKIAENELYFAREHLKNCGMVLQWDEKALSCLAENSGGARSLRREIEKTVLYPACKRLVSGENCPNVKLSAENGKIVLN